MLYAIISQDTPGSLAKRLEARPAHVARLEALRDKGRLTLAGPHPAIDNKDPGEAGFVHLRSGRSQSDPGPESGTCFTHAAIFMVPPVRGVSR